MVVYNNSKLPEITELMAVPLWNDRRHVWQFLSGRVFYSSRGILHTNYTQGSTAHRVRRRHRIKQSACIVDQVFDWQAKSINKGEQTTNAFPPRHAAEAMRCVNVVTQDRKLPPRNTQFPLHRVCFDFSSFKGRFIIRAASRIAIISPSLSRNVSRRKKRPVGKVEPSANRLRTGQWNVNCYISAGDVCRWYVGRAERWACNAGESFAMSSREGINWL